MKSLKYLLVVPALLVLSGSASAVLVSGISAGSGLGTVFTINSLSVSTPTPNDVALLGGPGAVGTANTITIDINVLAKHVPFSFDLAVLETGTPTAIMANVTRYTVSVILTHMVPGSPGNAINGFDITAGGSVAPLFNGLSLPISSTFTTNPVPLPGGTFRFGGLNGGGTGQILFGSTATSTVDLDVIALGGPSGPSVQTLTLTANPEPGTIALAALALLPVGMIVRRRRQQMIVSEMV